MFSLSPSITQTFHYRKLIYRSAVNEIHQRYAGSLIGLFWVMLYPAVLFVIYAVMYLYIFRIQPVHLSSKQYVIYIMSGLMPFLGFSEALLSGTSALSSKKNLLLNTVYPSEYIPLQAVVSSHLTSIFGVIVVVVTSFIILPHHSWTIVFLPLILIMQIMFVAGCVWFLSILNLIMKDIQQTLALLTIVLMIISPIAYTPDMVPGTLKLIMWFNPYSYYVKCFQGAFLGGNFFLNFSIAAVLSVSMYFSGYKFFTKVKTIFHDYV